MGENDEMMRLRAKTFESFAGITIAAVHRRDPSWPENDVKEWMKACFPAFGTRGYDWTVGAAVDLAKDFIDEARTW